MANDLKFIESQNGLLSGSTWPNPDFVDGTYALVQRITKCLLTNPGEDVFDPGYGSGLRNDIRGIAGQEIEKASQVVMGALKRVVENLSNPNLEDPAERLTGLQLLKLEYDPIQTAWSLDVEVSTEASSFPMIVSV